MLKKPRKMSIDKYSDGDYVLRRDVLHSEFKGEQNTYCWIDIEEALDVVSSADVVAVKYGKWLDKTMTVTNGRGQTYGRYGCSECKFKVRWKSRFCPNCGALMGEIK